MKPEHTRINLRHIYAFLEVSRHNSFTLAAEALNITQPALTSTIKQIEEYLGVQLFDRTTRTVLLTSDGADLLPIAQRLADSFGEALDQFVAIAERRKGNVSISALLSVAVNVLPKAIRLFSERYPQIRLNVRDENSAAVVSRVRQREADFGISSTPDSSADLDFRVLFSEPFGVVCRADWFRGHNAAIDWQDLTRHDYIGFMSETGIHSKIVEVPGLPENILHPRYTVATISAFEGLLYEGLGFSILPWLTCPFKSVYRIRFIKIINPSITREIGLLTYPHRALSAASRAMYDLIVENVGRFLAPDIREFINLNY